MKKLKRFTEGNVELRETEEGGSRGWGHFLVFNQETELWDGFREKIDPAALDDVMGDDVAVLTNHDTNQILARTSAGNAWITKDDVGGVVEWVFPDTTAGRDTKENMRVKNITGMSFGFTVKEDKLDRDKDTGTVTRTILKLERLYDASPVVFPAYQQTDTQLRAEIESREDYPKEEQEERIDPDDDKAKVKDQQRMLALRISIHKNK